MRRKFWKKLTAAFLTTAMAAAMLTGCGAKETTDALPEEGVTVTENAETQAGASEENAEASTGDRPIIGVSLPSLELARCLKDQQYITQYLDEMGYDVDVQFAKGDANLQASQVENMISNGVVGVILSPWDGSSMTSVVEIAHNNEIPVIAYDANILNSEYIDYYAADDLEGIGACQAQYIVDTLGVAEGKGPFNVELFCGDFADSNAIHFYNGAYNVLSPYIEEGSLIVKSGQTDFNQTATADWDASKAQSRMDTVLSTFYTDDTLDAVLTQNDGIALGCISSLKSVGYGSDSKPLPITTGQDCDLTSIKSIIAGEQSMTVYKDISQLAKTACYMIDCLVKGEEPVLEDAVIYDNGVKEVTASAIEPVALTKDNVDELIIESGFYTEEEVYGK